MISSRNKGCHFKQGALPDCAPLAAAYTPFQQESAPMYEPSDALARGTLFPGLDLPFMNMVNKTSPYAGTPIGELMALDFVIKEMNLYLDTHPEDHEAFRYLKEVLKLYAEGKRVYTEKCGPIRFSDVAYSESFNWLDGPWPWQCSERSGD